MTVRWGILGAGKFARQQMAPAIHAAEHAELAAIATSDPARAAPFQAFAPRLEIFDSYDALLASDQVDAVYVPLPNHLHVEWTLKALAAGKPVLTEKPLALKAEEFDRVIAARDASGLLAAEAYMIVHHPQWLRARDLVQGGAIGRLLQIEGAFSYDNSGDPGNIRNRPETGGGSLPDIGVYPIGAARFVTGREPDEVRAEIVWENGVDVTAHVVADFAGVRFQATTSMRMHPRQEMTFHGSDGILRLNAPFNPNTFDQGEVRLVRNVQPGGAPSVMVERWPGVNQYVLQVQNFGAAMRGEAAYPCPLEFSRGTQVVIDRALAYARSSS